MGGIQGKVARAACVAAFAALAGATPAFSAVELDQNAIVVAGPNSSGSSALGFGTLLPPTPDLEPRYTFVTQSVTAGKTGFLDHLDVQLVRLPVYLTDAQGTVKLSLFDGDLAAGTGSFVTSREISADTLPITNMISTEFAQFDLRDADFLLADGQRFSFKVEFFTSADVSQYINVLIGNVEIVTDPVWDAVNKNNVYAGGEGHYGTSVYGIGTNPLPGDLGFRSFIDVSTSAVPEPASWALMLMGFGALGGAMRRRTVRVVYA